MIIVHPLALPNVLIQEHFQPLYLHSMQVCGSTMPAYKPMFGSQLVGFYQTNGQNSLTWSFS